MTKIKLYSNDTVINPNDRVIGSDSANSDMTKNFTVESLGSYFYSEIIETLGATNASSIFGGTVLWLQDMDYSVISLSYIINGTVFSNLNENVTLEPSDPVNPRIDIIYADNQGNIGVITGQPSSNPIAPIVEINTQILVTTIYISAGATQPDDVSRYIVYSDNLSTDWEPWVAAIDASKVDFDHLINVNSGTKSITIKGSDPSRDLAITFTNQDDNLQSLSALQFYLSVEGRNVEEDSVFKITFQDGNSNVLGVVSLSSGFYGFNALQEGFQSIVIPINNIPNIDSLETLVIQLNQGASIAAYIDDIQLVGGVVNSTTQKTYLSLLDTVDNTYINKGGFTPVVDQNVLKLVKAPLSIDDHLMLKADGNTDITQVELNDAVMYKEFTKDGVPFRVPYAKFVNTLSDGDTENLNNYTVPTLG